MIFFYTELKEEKQTIEWKWSWDDEYLKWLCGYANVDGGTLYIGVNDDGYVVGVKDVKNLLESLPNKIIDKLGIVAKIDIFHVYGLGNNIRYEGEIPENIKSKLINRFSCGEINSDIIKKSNNPEMQRYAVPIRSIERDVELHINDEGILDYIAITIEKYPFAISCDGKYYKRSGSTLQLLSGLELQNFLLERAGKTWDSMPVPGVTVENLDKRALDAFRNKAVQNGRMSESEVAISDELLLHNLKLFDGDSGMLTRAAILLFHPDPEQFITGTSVRIAFFAPAGTYGSNSDADVIYHDEVTGPLMTLVDDIEDILYKKYFKAMISYDKLRRIETYMISRKIARELILNPINHKDYAPGVPVQVSVYDDHIEVFNIGSWPEELPTDVSLFMKHESIPHNPKIANVFYRSGEIDSWGSGYLKVRLECEKTGNPLPEVKINKRSITVIANACEKYIEIYNNTLKNNDMRKESYLLATDEGNQLVNDNGASLSVEVNHSLSDEEMKIDQERRIAYERMLEICSNELKPSEKDKLYPIVEFFSKQDELDRTKVEEICHVSSSTALNYLNRLINLGVIKKCKDSVATNYRLIF